MKRRWLLIMVLMVGWVPLVRVTWAAPDAQTGSRLWYGDTVTGAITAEKPCVLYWFEGMAGDSITVDMTRTGGDLDGVLALYLRDGAALTADPIASNDDRPGGKLDPLLETRLPQTDWYTLTACRLQHPQMRVTSGTFRLTLTGPDPAAPHMTPTPPPSLTEGVFPSGGEGGSTPEPSPTSSLGPLFGVLGGGAEETSLPVVTLADGVSVTGQVAAGDTPATYDLPVRAGDWVVLRWQREGGEGAPALVVTDADGAEIARAEASDPVGELRLGFRAATDGVLTASVGRLPEDEATGAMAFRLGVSITSGSEPAPGGAVTTPPPAPDEATPAGDYLAHPCQAGDQAATGLLSSERLVDVYTAAGDSYYADQLTRTAVFARDDDLNVVFLVQNTTVPLNVAGVFCMPDGSYQDAGGSAFEAGGPYLVGLDWEYVGELWPTGRWFAEIYVDHQLELVLAFTVE